MIPHGTEQVISIREVSRITSTPAHTIRFWERELEGIVVSQRSKGGQRQYSRHAVRMIEQIRRMRQEGLSLQKIRLALGSSGNSGAAQAQGVDALAERVSALVRQEIYSFFRGQEPQ